MTTNVNSSTTDCGARTYASERGYQECMYFEELQKGGGYNQKPVSLNSKECYPTYGKSSPPVCATDTTGRCLDSGLMNVTGFPPCCNPDIPESCIISSSNPYIVSSSKAQEPAPLPRSTDNLAGAAAGCVAKNPNYPAPKEGCVYNSSNPCLPDHYEITDSRFGTRMCCAPENQDNAACFSKPGKSNFSGIIKKNGKYSASKDIKKKSTFGSTDSNVMWWVILIAIALLIYFLFFSKKRVSFTKNPFRRFNFGKR